MLLVVSIVAVVGAVLASVTPASLNATFTLTVVAPASRAAPFASFTKSRPLVNSSWILYTYSEYPVVSGITPVTIYVTTWPISAVSLSAVLVMLGASVFKFTFVVSASTVTKEDWISFPPVTYTR